MCHEISRNAAHVVATGAHRHGFKSPCKPSAGSDGVVAPVVHLGPDRLAGPAEVGKVSCGVLGRLTENTHFAVARADILTGTALVVTLRACDRDVPEPVYLPTRRVRSVPIVGF